MGLWCLVLARLTHQVHPSYSHALFSYASGAAKKCGPGGANWKSGSPGQLRSLLDDEVVQVMPSRTSETHLEAFA